MKQGISSKGNMDGNLFLDCHGNIKYIIKDFKPLQQPTAKTFQSDYWFLDVSFSGSVP